MKLRSYLKQTDNLISKSQKAISREKVQEAFKSVLDKVEVNLQGVDHDEVFDNIIDVSYELLPAPIRLLVKRDRYGEIIRSSKDDIIVILSEKGII